MANGSISAVGGKGTKRGGVSATSAGKTSQRKEKVPISKEVRLRILQQALFDCQECGYEIQIVPIPGGIGIGILGSIGTIEVDGVVNLTAVPNDIAT
jgi:hypothetical protein